MPAALEDLGDDPLIGDSVAGFLADHHRVDRLRLDAREAATVFDTRVWRGLADLGVLALRLPEHLGGSGLQPRAGAQVAEAAGFAMLPEPLIACGLVLGALNQSLPPSSGQAELRAGLVDGGTLSTLCWQGDANGLDPGAATVKVDRQGRVSGDLGFVPAADLARWFVALAWRDEVPVLVVLDRSSVELDTPRRLGDGGVAATVRFDAAPIAHVLCEGPASAAAVQGALDEGALYSAAYLNGLGRQVFERLLQHLRQRIQFGRPLGAFQTLQHQAVDLYLSTRLSAAATRRAAIALEQQPGSAFAQAEVSAAKARAGESATAICRGAIQVFGGMGFAEEAGLGLALRIALQHAAAYGPRTAHLRRFGRLTGVAA